MDGQHPRAELRGRRHGAGHLVRDVVKLQIEKHAVPLVDETTHERRSFDREQRAADLDSAHPPLETERQLGCVNRVVDVEGD